MTQEERRALYTALYYKDKTESDFRTTSIATMSIGLENFIIEAGKTLKYHAEMRRFEQLKAMHNLMTIANDEQLYYAWSFTGVPDEASIEDLVEMSIDPETVKECYTLCRKLFNDKGWL